MREWIYGRNPVYEVLQTSRRSVNQLLVAQGARNKGRLKDILGLASKKDVSIEYVPRGQLEEIHPQHQGVLLSAGQYQYSSISDILGLAEKDEQPPLVLILDSLKDPQNLGTLLRTAEVVAVHGVLLPLRRTATVTPAVVAASSGASEHMLIAQVNLAQAINKLKNEGVWVIGLESTKEAKSLEEVDLGGPLALVVGSEGEGMRALVRKSCDQLIRLPMRGRINSLNAAVAGSIALYLAWAARGYQSVI